jgi:hypothetical protein
MRGVSACALAVFATALQTGCIKPAPPVNVYRLGEKVRVGPLTYNVLEANWRAQISDAGASRIPSHRFLVVHLTVTNSGAEETTAPALTVVDQAKKAFDEYMDGQGIPNWLGMIRKMKPAETLDGSILFDVDPKSYKLKLDDGSGGPQAMVELPLQFEAGQSSVPSALQDKPNP